MKKFGKLCMLILLVATIVSGSFFLGVNANNWNLAAAGQLLSPGQSEPPASLDFHNRQSQQRIMDNIAQFEDVIDQAYLFDYKKEDLETGLYKGLFEGLNDPYSVYYTKAEFQRLMEDSSGSFHGIGIVVTVGEDGLITIVSPIQGTPGEKAGLKAGDKILTIDGVSYLGSELDKAVDHMRGEEGSEVTLVIRRSLGGKTENKEVKVTRQTIHVDSVVAKALDDHIGYIQITSFEEDTAKLFDAKRKELEKAGCQKLILDLRNNPGGLLTSCEEIADQLLGEGVIVTTVDKQGKKQEARSDKAMDPIPLVVLVNEGSASASEILLGALRDHQRAKSVGQKTYGKGIVQRIYPLSGDDNLGGFKLTMAEYLTPSGEKIHKKGITPDYVVDLPQGAGGIGPDYLTTDSQLQKALEIIKAENE